ncbi:DUF3306 domain-containing protein [Bradyrhizobium liaoningense]|nr:DUF3306 domain-containing protein [Bradyrhizobium liaoningense]
MRMKQASIAPKHAVPEIAVSSKIPDPISAVKPLEASSLPPIESITADSNVTAFLREDVPAELTRAALRRAWTIDPSIRDFIGIAEKQWDFNDPDGIPGFGPLTPLESGPSAVNSLIATSIEHPEAPLAHPDLFVDAPGLEWDQPLQKAEIGASSTAGIQRRPELPGTSSL